MTTGRIASSLVHIFAEVCFMSSTITARAQALGLPLEPAGGPAANYVSKVQVGDLRFVSGQVPRQGDQPVWQGRVGDPLSEEEGRPAAPQAARSETRRGGKEWCGPCSIRW